MLFGLNLDFLKNINESKLFLGIIMLILNIGSRYINLGFSKTQEQFLRDLLIREVLIFAVAFTATRDIIMAIITTASFVILADVFFHEKSNYCVVPDRMNKIQAAIDVNNDKIISPQEELNAITLLKNAEKQKKRQMQSEFMDKLNINSSYLLLN
jgi:uncharacterized membrane protein (DUF106 family)